MGGGGAIPMDTMATSSMSRGSKKPTSSGGAGWDNPNYEMDA